MLSLSRFIKGFAIWAAAMFVLFIALCWTPLNFFPMLLGIGAAAGWPGIMVILLILGVPFGGFFYLVVSKIWYGERTLFWKEAGCLTGYWCGSISGSVAGIRLYEGNL